MKKFNSTMLLLALILFTTEICSQQTASEVLNKSLMAIGGKEKISEINYIEFKGTGFINFPSIATWKDGAQPRQYQDTKEIIDIKNHNLLITNHLKFNFINVEIDSKTIYSNGIPANENKGKLRAGSISQAQTLEFKFYENPLYLLTEAEKNRELRLTNETTIKGVKHFVLGFNKGNTEFRIFINSLTYLPDKIEYTEARTQDIFNAFWGDMTTTVNFDSWIRDSTGIRFPNSWSYESEGFNLGELSVLELKINPQCQLIHFTFRLTLKKNS